MSASLLNAATAPGSVPAGAGIAAQAAQAAQAKGPMAGFEALLAAFFGDQGLTAPAVAGQAAGIAAAQPGGVAALAGAPIVKTAGKAATSDKDAAPDSVEADPPTGDALADASVA